MFKFSICFSIFVCLGSVPASAETAEGNRLNMPGLLGIGCPLTYTRETDSDFCYLVCRNVRINSPDSNYKSQDIYRSRNTEGLDVKKTLPTPPVPPLYRLECRPKGRRSGVEIHLPSFVPGN